MNSRIDRRRFVLAIASSLAAATLPQAVRAAMGPTDKFDLVIRGGEVLDPSQRLRAVRDIGIKNGMIEAVETAIPAERAASTRNQHWNFSAIIDWYGNSICCVARKSCCSSMASKAKSKCDGPATTCLEFKTPAKPTTA